MQQFRGELITINVFDNVYNNEKGKILIATGIHKVNITNSVFVNSYKIQIPVQLCAATLWIIAFFMM